MVSLPIGAILGAALALHIGCSPRANQSEPLGTTSSGMLAQGPMLGPETALDEPVFDNRLQAAAPAVASNGTSYLLVWSESLMAPVPQSPTEEAFGIRLDGNATPLDAQPFSLSFPSAARPSVASNGTDYLVLSGGLGLRVAAAGTLLDAAPFSISTSVALAASRAASNGTDYLVVWIDTRTGGADIYAARVSASGTVLDPGGIPIAIGASAWPPPDVAWNGAHYVMVWQADRNGDSYAFAARVSAAGSVLDSGAIAVTTQTTPQSWPRIACRTPECLIVWQATVSGSVNGARFKQDGTFLDPDGFSLAQSAESLYWPQVAWNGSNYVVYWGTDPCVDTQCFAGRVVSASGVVGGLAGGYFRHTLDGNVASNGTTYLLGLGLREAPPFGAVSAEARVFRSVDNTTVGSWGRRTANQENKPIVTHDSKNFLVVWRDTRSPSPYDNVPGKIYGARVSAAGSALDPTGIAIDTRGRNHGHSVSAAADNHLIVTTDWQSEIPSAFRVSSSGSLLDQGGFKPASNPAVFYRAYSNGAEHLVVWKEMLSDAFFGRRIRPDGTYVDPAEVPVSFPPGDWLGPAVWTGSHYWVAGKSSSANGEDVHVGRFGPTFDFLDGAPTSVCAEVGDQAPRAVAWSGSVLLVVWQDLRSGEPELYAARVGDTGSVFDPGGYRISSASAPDVVSISASATWTGSSFVVVWSEAAAGDARRGVRAAQVSPDGLVHDAPSVLISNSATEAQVDSFGDGHALIAYSRYESSIRHKADRVFARVFAESCECDAGTCAGGFTCFPPAPDSGPDAGPTDGSPDAGDAPGSGAGGNQGGSGGGASGDASGGSAAGAGLAGSSSKEGGSAAGSDAGRAAPGARNVGEDGSGCTTAPAQPCRGAPLVLLVLAGGLLARFGRRRHAARVQIP